MLAAGIGLLAVAGFDAPPAAACSCAVGGGDRGAFEQADVVFVGDMSDYERRSFTEARWTFTVSRVYKGEVAQTQPIVSAFSGATCGLELPEHGEFLVFANGRAGPGSDPRAGEYHAGLCGGTRSTSGGPLEAGLANSRPPEGAQVSQPSEARVDGVAGGSSRARTIGIVVGVVVVVAGTRNLTMR